MRMHILRRLTAVVAATAVSIPLGLASAGATAPQSAAPATSVVSEAPIPGAYLSPWGSADVEISPSTLQWMEEQGIVLEAISPFEMHEDGRGFSMPIGSMAGDGLDEQGRIFYPGGLQFHHQASGKTVVLKPTWIRVMPTPGWSSGVTVDGETVSDETLLGRTSYAEVMATARPSPTGWRLEKVPFYVTEEAAELFAQHSGGSEGPAAGSLFGTLTPNFDYVPTDPNAPSNPAPPFPGGGEAPRLPGFPG